MILFPNAKINLGLHILNKRTDGYHNLETLMVPIPLTDVLTLNKTESATTQFQSTGLVIDGDSNSNLVVKAYQLLNEKFHLPPVAIHLHKTIPFGAGLGGGSSDAAFMLKGLNDFFHLSLTDTQLEDYAAQLGSDCPFFVKNIPALATRRGEVLQPIGLSGKRMWLMLVVPDFGVSTKDAYAWVQPKIPEYRIMDSLQKPIEIWRELVKNDFENSVFQQKPENRKIKEDLYKMGAVYASLSGSGSACFGIFYAEPLAEGLFPETYFIWKTDKFTI